MTYPEYLLFLEEFFELIGEPQKKHKPIKGDYFLL